jgi:LysM repeat protein
MRTLPISLVRLLAVTIVTVSLTGMISWQTASAENLIHIVQPNENLFRIGLKYGVSWVAIMQANGLTSTTIYVGQELIIPVDAAATSAAPEPLATPEAAATPEAPATPVAATPVAETPVAPAASATYTVQRGDTLFRIAARFGVPAADIAAANNLYNPSLIYAGQMLYIPGAGAAPVSGANTTKKIVVSISQQHVYAYDSDTLVYSFVASTGLPGADTRPGSYSVLDKIPNAYGANWDLWMPNWLGIYWAGRLENGIHALPILSGGQRLWEGYLGSPISYGCIVLGVDDSQALYDWAEIGTPVYIQP